MRTLIILAFVALAGCASHRASVRPEPVVAEESGSGGGWIAGQVVSKSLLAQSEVPNGPSIAARFYSLTTTSPTNGLILASYSRICLEPSCTRTISWDGAKNAFVGDLYTDNALTSGAAAGANAYVMNAGARLCFKSDCSVRQMESGGIIYLTGSLAISATTYQDGILYQRASIANDSSGAPVRIADAEGLRLEPPAGLATCAASLEGTLQTVAAAAAVRTKVCACTSDGAATPAFAWQNISNPELTLAASIGTATACP